jgi:hypothetical protein
MTILLQATTIPRLEPPLPPPSSLDTSKITIPGQRLNRSPSISRFTALSFVAMLIITLTSSSLFMISCRLRPYINIPIQNFQPVVSCATMRLTPSPMSSDASILHGNPGEPNFKKRYKRIARLLTPVFPSCRSSCKAFEAGSTATLYLLLTFLPAFMSSFTNIIQLVGSASSMDSPPNCGRNINTSILPITTSSRKPSRDLSGWSDFLPVSGTNCLPCGHTTRTIFTELPPPNNRLFLDENFRFIFNPYTKDYRMFAPPTNAGSFRI